MNWFEVDYRPGKKPPDDIFGCRNVADDACVILWGTLPLMQQVQLHHKWVPGGWCNVEKLDCATYSLHFGPFLLNGRHSILPGVDAIEREEELFSQFGADNEVFVRPSGVRKLFPGKVVYKDNFREAIAASHYDPAMQVLVAPPKDIGREWRLVIAGDEVVAASQYRENGEIVTFPDYSEQVSQFAADALRHVQWRPDTLFVMDICEAENRLQILDLNSFSCSGFYDCDAEAIVRAASVAAENEWRAAPPSEVNHGKLGPRQLRNRRSRQPDDSRRSACISPVFLHPSAWLPGSLLQDWQCTGRFSRGSGGAQRL